MRLRRLVLSFLATWLVIGAAESTATATTNFNVSNVGMSAFAVDGVDNPDLTLTRGQSYTFTVSAVGHPFWITTVRGAGDTSGNAFSAGVTNNGASPGTVTFVVPASAPATLFYQCAFHDTMGGTLNIVAPAPTAVPSIGSVGFGALAGLLLLVAVVALRRQVRA